jgi:antitoxin ParD1/3/4
MEQITVPLSEEIREFVEARVSEGGYPSAGDYLLALIDADQKRNAEERLEALLVAGLDSGTPTEVTPEYWERKRARLMELHEKASGE